MFWSVRQTVKFEHYAVLTQSSALLLLRLLPTMHYALVLKQFNVNLPHYNVIIYNTFILYFILYIYWFPISLSKNSCNIIAYSYVWLTAWSAGYNITRCDAFKQIMLCILSAESFLIPFHSIYNTLITYFNIYYNCITGASAFPSASLWAVINQSAVYSKKPLYMYIYYILLIIQTLVFINKHACKSKSVFLIWCQIDQIKTLNLNSD